MNQDQLGHAPVLRRDDDGDASYDTEPHGRKAPANPLLIVHSLLRGRYLVTGVLALVAAGAGAAVGYRSTKPVYQSVGTIRIKPTIPSITAASPDTIMPAFGQFFNSQLEFLSGERVITRAMEMSEWQQVRPGLAPQQIAGFRNGISVSSPKGTELIRVGFTDEDPAAAINAVNCLIKSYMDLYGASDTTNSAQLIGIYERIQLEEGSRLAQLERTIAETAGTDVDIDSIHKLYVMSLEETSTREKAWNEVRRVLKATDVAQAGRKDGEPAPTTQAGAPSPEEIAQTDRKMWSLLEERRKAQQEVRLARIRAGSANPRVIEAQQRVQMIEEDIEAYAKAFSSAVHVPVGEGAQTPQLTQAEAVLQALRMKERSLKEFYDESAQNTKALGQKLYRIQSLKRDADDAKRKYDDAVEKIQRIRLQDSLNGQISVVNYGEKPLQPFEDKRMKQAAVGACGGGAIPVVLMLAIGLLNRRLISVQDVRLGGHPIDRVLGVLPHVPDSLVDAEQAAVAAHCVHHIRTLLQLEPGLPPRRVYALTSPSPGDGKTTLTIALGMSFASSGAKTLLIDCDMVGGGLTSKMDQMIRPKIGRVLRREGLLTDEQLTQALRASRQSGRPLGEVLVALGFVSDADVVHATAVQSQSYVGLLDVIRGEPLAECVTGTGRPGLFILPLGSAGAHHASQLSPVTIQRILAEARAAFDVVLVDTGPILGSLEASIVAAQADAAVLAVSRGAPQGLVKRSLDGLVQVGARVVGMVLNRAAATEVADFAFSSGSVRSYPNRRLAGPVAPDREPEIRLGAVGTAVASAATETDREVG
jgi:Mrp family chromosome partitioning ATPase